MEEYDIDRMEKQRQELFKMLEKIVAYYPAPSVFKEALQLLEDIKNGVK